MAVIGIVAEYNPFHNGHKFHIDASKKNGDAVVVAMSSNVVQRGDFALFSKWTRANAALLCGADLVVEIPSVYSLATAERYAFGAVSTLNMLGFVDKISFGAETEDVDALRLAAEKTQALNQSDELKNRLKSGETFIKARTSLVSSKSGLSEDFLKSPNNILAVEYIRAVNKIGAPFEICPVLRTVEHDGKETVTGFASASFLRDNLTAENIKKFVPKEAAELFLEQLQIGNYSLGINALETAVLSKLKTSNADDLLKIAEIGEGLENKIIKAAKASQSLDELYKNIKSKRYTMSRVRRAVLSSLLDVTKQSQQSLPPYVRILGFNAVGMNLLKNADADANLISSLKKIDEKNKTALEFSKAEERITDIFSLSLKDRSNAKNENANRIITI